MVDQTADKAFQEPISDDGASMTDLRQLLISIRDSADEALVAFNEERPMRSVARFVMFVNSDSSRAYEQLTAIAEALNG